MLHVINHNNNNQAIAMSQTKLFSCCLVVGQSTWFPLLSALYILNYISCYITLHNSDSEVKAGDLFSFSTRTNQQAGEEAKP